MKVLRSSALLLATFLWLFSIAHCHLEVAGLIAMDDCDVANETVPFSGDPCETQCQVLEQAPAKQESSKRNVVVLAVLLTTTSVAEVADDVLVIRADSLDTDPPLSVPLFVARRTLPARAPSILS